MTPVGDRQAAPGEHQPATPLGGADRVLEDAVASAVGTSEPARTVEVVGQMMRRRVHAVRPESARKVVSQDREDALHPEGDFGVLLEKRVVRHAFPFLCRTRQPGEYPPTRAATIAAFALNYIIHQ